jgi:hypothetical protein
VLSFDNIGAFRKLEDDVLVEDYIQVGESELISSQQEEDTLVQEDIQSFEGEWMDSWRTDHSANHGREKKKAKRRRNRNNKRLRGQGRIEVEPETIAVIFVEHTKNGELAKRLQKAEDEMAKTTGFRIRVTEMAGSQLRRILPNTNPWHGRDCGRERCVPCGQGTENLEDCRRRNILYESSCVQCNPPDTLYKKGAKLNNCEGVYVGESGRSLSEQAGEHHHDATSMKEDSHMLKHWQEQHGNQEQHPKFRFKIIGSFQDVLTRQVSEAVRIDLRGGGVLNSKSEYSRCKLLRHLIF